MLTRKQLVEPRDLAEDPESVIAMLVAEIEAQRAVVIAALGCTGEDGHDGSTDLSCAAEEYLAEIAKSDPRWTSWRECDALIQERK